MDHLWSKISYSKSKRQVLDFQVSQGPHGGPHQRGNVESKQTRKEVATS